MALYRTSPLNALQSVRGGTAPITGTARCIPSRPRNAGAPERCPPGADLHPDDFLYVDELVLWPGQHFELIFFRIVYGVDKNIAPLFFV